jgi:hypothetical protein
LNYTNKTSVRLGKTVQIELPVSRFRWSALDR